MSHRNKNYPAYSLLILIVALGSVALLATVGLSRFGYIRDEGVQEAVDIVKTEKSENVADDANEVDENSNSNSTNNQLEKSYAETRDAERWADVQALSKGIRLYTTERYLTVSDLVSMTTYGDGTCGTDRVANHLPNCTESITEIGSNVSNLDSSGDGVFDCMDYIDLGSNIGDLSGQTRDLLIPDSLPYIPEDPVSAYDLPDGGRATGYSMCMTDTNRLKVIVKEAETEELLEVVQ